MIAGSADASTIVCKPGLVSKKSIMSALGCALASRMACRSDPGPLSAEFVTRIDAENALANSVVPKAASDAYAVRKFPGV